MTSLIFFSSPLEQFQILPAFSLSFGFFDFSLTNETIILGLIAFFTLVFFFSLTKVSGHTFFIVPTRWQALIEIIYMSILKDKKSQLFFPLVFSLFLFFLSLNLIGLIPYSFALISHLIVTLGLSIAVFIGINIICVRVHGIKFFSLFLPSNTSVILAFLLVPIELISYIFKPIRLSARLFANMMAGLILLKVIVSFAFVLMGNAGIFFLLHFIPLLILIPLFGLELGVACIQAFVFGILICIYLNDAINLYFMKK